MRIFASSVLFHYLYSFCICLKILPELTNSKIDGILDQLKIISTNQNQTSAEKFIYKSFRYRNSDIYATKDLSRTCTFLAVRDSHYTCMSERCIFCVLCKSTSSSLSISIPHTLRKLVPVNISSHRCNINISYVLHRPLQNFAIAETMDKYYLNISREPPKIFKRAILNAQLVKINPFIENVSPNYLVVPEQTTSEFLQNQSIATTIDYLLTSKVSISNPTSGYFTPIFAISMALFIFATCAYCIYIYVQNRENPTPERGEDIELMHIDGPSGPSVYSENAMVTTSAYPPPNHCRETGTSVTTNDPF